GAHFSSRSRTYLYVLVLRAMEMCLYDKFVRCPVCSNDVPSSIYRSASPALAVGGMQEFQHHHSFIFSPTSSSHQYSSSCEGAERAWPKWRPGSVLLPSESIYC